MIFVNSLYIFDSKQIGMSFVVYFPFLFLKKYHHNDLLPSIFQEYIVMLC